MALTIPPPGDVVGDAVTLKDFCVVLKKEICHT